MPAAKKPTEQRQKLSLTTTSLRNLIVSNASDFIYYEIVTPRWAREVTTISRMDPNTRQYDVIGEMKNDKHGNAVEVRLYGGNFTPAHEFLKNGSDSAHSASFLGKDGKKYTWIASSTRLELIRNDTPDDKPVATYHKEKRFAYVLRMSQLPYLEIDPSALDTLDSLIMSFLIVERRRRERAI